MINTFEEYEKLKSTGFLWEFHPECTGIWSVDKKLFAVDGIYGEAYFGKKED